MLFMLIIFLMIIIGLSMLMGIGLAQAASKKMPKPTCRINHVSDDMMRQAFKDADEREMWG